MSDLLLDSLRIQNFRTFRDLTIDRLGRVNLVVGKNNVGKTALLEALWVWAVEGNFYQLYDLLEERDDTSYIHDTDSQGNEITDVPGQVGSICKLFNGGQADWPQRLEIGSQEDGFGTLVLELSRFEGSASEDRSLNGSRNDEVVPILAIVKGSDILREYDLAEDFSQLRRRSVMGKEQTNSVFLRARGLDPSGMASAWDDVLRQGKEESVTRTLRIIDDQIQDVQFVGSGGSSSSRTPYVKLEKRESRVPLANLGDGVYRLLEMGLSINAARGQLLLVDEIENGLHYSVQPDVWRMIFEAARELDVQVFATTHSYDCLRAFKRVAEDYDTADSALVSLRRHEDDPENIVAVEADRDEISIIVEENVEVR
jgi:predicted ATPase